MVFNSQREQEEEVVEGVYRCEKKKVLVSN
jgi:hypothetical protein